MEPAVKTSRRRHACAWLATTCITLALAGTAAALGPPRPGEIAQLKAAGRYRQSLENALRIGNHLTAPALARRLKAKAHRLKGVAPGPAEEYGGYGVQLPPAAEALLPASGAPRIFALLIEFNDHEGGTTFPKAGQDALLWGPENPATLPWDSLASFYRRSSYGALDLSQGLTLGWYKTSYDRSSVPETDAGRDGLIKEALDTYDAAVDFSQFDSDGDGAVDYFLVLWAGPSGAWATFWWQYSTSWSDAAYELDGKKLNRYTWQPVTDDPHIVIHETGHALGLPDLYDYNGDLGPRCGVGGSDPMDAYRGDHNCFSKWMLDWTAPRFVVGAPQELTLAAAATTQDQCVLLWNGAAEPGIFSEFFLAENKQDVGNDSNLHNFAAGTPDGLALWHVAAALDAAGHFANNNSTTDRKLVRLMEADGLEEIEAMVVPNGHVCFAADAGDFYNEGTDFTPTATPSSAKYDGADSCVRVMTIVDEGATPGAALTARFSSVCDNPPTAVAGGPYAAECQGPTTVIPLNGTGSSDPDPGDALSYLWSSACPGGGFDNPALASPLLTLSTTACATACSASLTVTDGADLSDTDSAAVTVTDSTPPAIACPATSTVECSSSTLPAATGAAVGSDACTATTVAYADAVVPGACPSAEIITRTWTATDGCSHVSSCSQTINVVDTTPPEISCNAPAAINPANAPVSFTATATDNCSTPAARITAFTCRRPESCVVSASGDTMHILDSGGVGDLITWTVESIDDCGNNAVRLCSLKVVNKKKSY